MSCSWLLRCSQIYKKKAFLCLKYFDNRQSEVGFEWSMNKKLLNSWNYFINSSKKEADSWIIVSFIPYFRTLVFGILVILFAFFTSCPSCLAKCKQSWNAWTSFCQGTHYQYWSQDSRLRWHGNYKLKNQQIKMQKLITFHSKIKPEVLFRNWTTI